MSNEILRWGIA